MCPCPICTSIVILLCPLLLFKGTRTWLKSKIKKHHCACDVCQQAEHEQHRANHTPCSCRQCQKKKRRVQKRKNGLTQRGRRVSR